MKMVKATPRTRTTAPSNITELRDDLLATYAEIGNGEITLPMAAEKANAAGKIIKTVALELAYSEMRKEKPEIPFLSGVRSFPATP
jgi:hypothetical protein